MKKLISLFLLLLLATSYSFAARYLVETGIDGDATWSRNAEDGETKVNLNTVGQSLNVWYATLSAGTAAEVNEIWLAGGSYQLTDFVNTKTFIDICGGFAGTELTLEDRAIESADRPWSFTNASTIIGYTGAVKPLIFPNAGAMVCNYDGLIVTGAEAGAIQIRPVAGSTCQIRNCIIRDNTNIQQTGGVAAVFCFGGGDVYNTLFENNEMVAGATTQSSALYTSGASTIQGCEFVGNKASLGGGTLRSQSTLKLEIKDCIFHANDHKQNGSAIYLQHNSAAAISPIIENCLIYDNTSKTAVYTNGWAIVRHCTFANNPAGAIYVANNNATNNTQIENSVFFGKGGISKAAGNAGSTITNCALSAGVSIFNGTNATELFTVTNTLDIADANDGEEGLYARFTNPEAGDFTITATSALLNTAAASAVAVDMRGVARPQGVKSDIGAYECRYYTIAATAESNGSVVGGGDYAEGAAVTLTATADDKFKFDGWYASDVKVSEQATYTFTATASVALAARFSLDTAIEDLTLASAIYGHNNSLTVEGFEGSMRVFNTAGMMVHSQMVYANTQLTLAKGLYVVELQSADTIQTRKVLVQ